MILVSWVFGWSGGRALVKSSYGDAKVRSREMSEERRKRKREKAQGNAEGEDG